MPMKRTADAMIFSGPGQSLRPAQFAAPDPENDEVLIRITACTLCGSDLHSFEGRRAVPVPTILGHEILGRIEAFGPGAARRDFSGQDLRIGDRVTWSIVASCVACFYCRRGLPQKCERMVKYGHEALQPGRELTGGLATFCRLAPGTAILRLPEDLPDEIACPANCATATVAAALDAAGDLRDRCVLVLGAGMLGLTASAMARSRGATVIACDTNAERLERARTFGAAHVASPENLQEAASAVTGRYGVDVVLELTGVPAALENAWPSVRIGGVIVLVGSVFPSRPMPLLLEQVVRRQLTLRGIHNYAPQHLVAALDFFEREKKYPFEALIADWLPLCDADRAFEVAGRPGTFRVGVRPA